MTTQTAPAVEPTSTGDISIDDLVARAGDLKGELVAFAQSPRFNRRLNALLVDAADRHGYLDEGHGGARRPLRAAGPTFRRAYAR